jgi:hypothetical protein
MICAVVTDLRDQNARRAAEASEQRARDLVTKLEQSQAELRDKIQAWIEGRQHWLIACDARERPWLDALFAAVNAGWQPGTPRVPVEVLDLDLHQVERETGEERCVGVLFLVAIPRASLSAETLQTTILAHHGVEVSCAHVLEAQFLSPMAMSHLWSMGERIKAFTTWLDGAAADEEEDDDDASSR